MKMQTGARLWRRLVLLVSLTGSALLLTFAHGQATPSPAGADLANRHPDAGIWVSYRGDNSVADLQKHYIKGIMAYAVWNQVYPSEGSFAWGKLDTMLDFAINKVGKKSFIDVTVGYCPELEWPQFMRDQVASRKTPNNDRCYPLQFWDPVYLAFHKAYITALADHLAEFDATDARPTTTDILFVRALPMAETMENLPNEADYGSWRWQDFNPAPNGRIHMVDLTAELAYAYDREIVFTYQQELKRAYGARGLTPPVPVAKAGTFWKATPNRDLFVNAGIWFNQHNGAPTPQGWYYDMIEKVRSGATRGTFESGNTWPEAMLTQYTYWEVLAALHSGIEFIGIYGTNKRLPQLQPKGPVNFVENSEALALGERYAGHLRNPALAPGAWIALRGGYPENRWADRIHQVRVWTNYEFLLTQYRPQDSVPLFGVTNTQDGLYATVPVVTRNTPQPWTDEVTVCRNNYSAAECEFLHNQPDLYLQQNQERQLYTFRQSDLGIVPSCAGNLFCENSSAITRAEPMLWARRTDGANGHNFMRFNLNDPLAATLDGRAVVRIVYLDQGSGKWELRYDGKAGAEQSAIIVQKTNTNRWKESVVQLSDVRFANQQEGGTDLSLYNMGDDDDIFHMLEIIRPAPSYEHQLYLPVITG